MRSTLKKLFDGQAENAVSELENVDNSRHLIVAIDTENSANCTIRFKGSIQDTPPDFSSAQAVDNQWEYLQLKDLMDGSSIDGDTGLALAGTDAHRMFEINTNGIKYVVAEVSSHVAGNVDVQLRAFNEG